ncbi:MAG: hypothetical protein CMJ35_07170 [Phycisphaerae bacterium]|nr:hypothetical protein [Phycisphaerae bacterium]MBM91381.1 hypothetical protein [Phycisphaerae bacterium]
MSTPPSTHDTTTWATLLAGWVHYAQSAVALPDTAEGQRWKDSVAPTIALHAHAMALGEIEKVAPDERALAMDKSELSIKEHAGALNQIWRGEPMPESIGELIQDAKDAWEAALHEGVVWIVKSERFKSFHPGELIEMLLDAGFIGEVLIATPGIEMFKGAPVATCRENFGGEPGPDITRMIDAYLHACDGEVDHPQIIRPVCQVYRQFDFLAGGAQKDVVAPVTGDLQSGQPLLIPVVSGGASCAVPLPQRASKPLDLVRVEWLAEEGEESPSDSL